MNRVFEGYCRSLMKFNSKNPTKLLLLWNVNHFKHFCLLRNIESRPLTSDSVVVYEDNNSKFVKRLKILNVVQFVVWNLYAGSLYDLTRKKYLKIEKSTDETLVGTKREMKIINNLYTASLFIGLIVYAVIGLFFLRLVKHIKLNKITNTVTFETYGFFSKTTEFSVPLTNISGVKIESGAKSYIPLKVKDKFLYFLVDTKGNFKDGLLFYNVIASHRNLKNI